MKAALNIFFSVDKNFITHFSVAVTSLLENNRELELNIFLIHDLQNLDLLNPVLLFIKNNYGISLHLLSINNVLFKSYQVSHHLSKAVYFRLLLAEIIPAHIDCGIFLDSDIVVTGSLKELTDFSFARKNMMEQFNGEYALFAVDDNPANNNISRLNDLGFATDRYFNAGVMMINLNLWRKNHVTDKLFRIANQYMQQLVWWDQDILNMCFINEWGKLSENYNALRITETLPEKPLIIHYAGASKPWQRKNKHPYKNEYFYYLKKRKYKLMNPNMIFVYSKLLKIFGHTFNIKIKNSLL